MRTLIVKDYDHPMYPDSLRSVAILNLPWGVVDLDEIPQKVHDELAEARIAAYELKDSRSIEVMGAGFNSQHVLLTLASGAAEGTASALIERLAKWCTRKNRDQEKGATQFDQSVESAKKLITDHFNPQGHLEALEISISDERARFVLQDSLRNQFVVETKGSSNSIVAKRILDSSQS
jgi:hypothetical protein